MDINDKESKHPALTCFKINSDFVISRFLDSLLDKVLYFQEFFYLLVLTISDLILYLVIACKRREGKKRKLCKYISAIF